MEVWNAIKGLKRSVHQSVLQQHEKQPKIGYFALV